VAGVLKSTYKPKAGWKVAGEYMEDPAAGDSNEEKHIRDAERSVERKIAKEKGN